MNISRQRDNKARARLSKDLLCLCKRVDAAMTLPRIDHIYLPPPQTHAEKARKFGLVVLEDESTGFFFTLLDTNSATRRTVIDVAPMDVLELACWFESGDMTERAIGLGAIGAITQALFRKSGFQPQDAINPIANLRPGPRDHIGMVGYFPALVKRLREDGVPLTVLELDEKWVQEEDAFEVTLDPARLRKCNKILCTASTLINDTVDDILRYAEDADYVALIGPSAGCLPDPLFARGIDLVGGSAVTDYARLEACCESGDDWGDSVRKYCLAPSNYPGAAKLIDRLRDA